MIAFTKTLARDLGPYGVTVYAIAPGQIETRMGTAMPADYLAALTAQIPLGRLGSASASRFRFASWHRMRRATSPVPPWM